MPPQYPYSASSWTSLSSSFYRDTTSTYDDSDTDKSEESDDQELGHGGNYDTYKLGQADLLINKIIKARPGAYTNIPILMIFVKVLVRAVAVRQHWYTNQRRIYSKSVFTKIRAWAPHLFKFRGGIYALINHAVAKGMPISYDPLTHKFDVYDLVKPVLRQLHPRLKEYR